MENGTITVISSRPMGPQDYAKMGYDAAMQDVQALYSQIMQRAGGAKGKGDVQPSKDTKSKAAEVKSQGRGNDTELAHITPKEAKMLKANGGRGSRNPKTGLLEFDGDGGGGDSGGGDAGGGDAGGSDGEGGGGAPAGGDVGNAGDAATGGVSGSSPGDVAAGGGDQPGGGYGGPGGAPGTSGYGSSLGIADSSSETGMAGNMGNAPDETAAVVGEAAGRTHTSPATNFGIGVNNALQSVLSVAGPIGAIVGGNPSPLGMAASIAGPAGGMLGAGATALGFGNSAANALGFNTGVSGPTPGSGGLAGNMGTDTDVATGQGFGGGSVGSPDTGPGANDTELALNSLSGNTISNAPSPGVGSNSGSQSSGSSGSGNLDSAVQSIFARPGSKTIAGTPYAPSFGKDSDINPAALSAALGAINRPRPGPGLQFGRTTYL